MSRSWGHAVRRLTEAEVARWAEYDCSSGKCTGQATHATTYNYVTGRAGRVSWSERRVCTVHAEKFAAKHGAEITDAPGHEHAAQQAFRAMFGAAEDSSLLAAKEAGQ